MQLRNSTGGTALRATDGTAGLRSVVAGFVTYFKSFAETLAPSETLVRKTTRAFAETADISEVFSKATTFRRAFAETLSGVSETFVRKTKKVFAETANLSETLVRKTRTSFAETLTITEDWTRKVTYHLAFAEATSMAETLIRTFIAAGAASVAGHRRRRYIKHGKGRTTPR